MTAETRRLVEKLMSYRDVLRDDGVGVIEYTEQLTYLLFLKMAHERANRRLQPEKILPDEFSWTILLDAQGASLESEYARILQGLARQPGVVGTIFRKAQNRLQDPATLKRLIVDLIDKEHWTLSGTDLTGDAYEELLSRGASDMGSGAGQYFTPRALVQAIVDVMRPSIDDSVVDPACGTGGFLLAAHQFVAERSATMTPAQREYLRDSFASGVELVDGTARLASMNMLLHGIGKTSGKSVIDVRDSLSADPGNRWSMVLSNPPFGTKSSVTMIGADGAKVKDDRAIERHDFVTTTANKQLNFVQHISTILAINGRAAVVLPDNVLFEGGPGETIRRRLLQQFDLHTMIRLPTGIFYANGVKANVLFFDKKPARDKPWTERLWIYDLRTNKHFTLKQNPLSKADLADFIGSFKPARPASERVESERWKSYSYENLMRRDKANLDITWLRDETLADANDLLTPDVIAREIVDDLTAALAEFEEVAAAVQAQLADESTSTCQPIGGACVSSIEHIATIELYSD